MFVLAFTSVLTGLLALFLYQRIFYPFFWVDVMYALKLRRYKKVMRARMEQGVVSFLDCFVYQSRKKPNKPFIIFEDQTLTYRDVERRSNQFANAFMTEGCLKKGDTVAQFMSNEPDFVHVWLGLCKLGCEVAFINVNIKAKSLLHCFHSCGAKTLVVGADLVQLVKEVLPDLKKNNVAVWVVDHSSPSEDFNTLLDKVDQMSGDALRELPKVDIMSNFLFIFTSGTTGLSKAACVGHLKSLMSMALLYMCGGTSDDIIYITLPLYHMSALLLGLGGCINLGATCVLKKKFSASQFWKDCVKHNVSVVQYIGELCRYLVNHPVVPEERAHCVRLAVGSGLRSDVWKEFVRRFGRITVREGYGLTEASIGFLNYTDEVGPIGRASYFNKGHTLGAVVTSGGGGWTQPVVMGSSSPASGIKLLMPFELLRYDPQTYEPVRTDDGRCIRAQKGETGILVAPLTAMNPFLGYAGDKDQSEKKLLRNVFRSGDIYFNTGDLLLHDHRDFLYFRDRIGDTFRWKGENVSTTDVSEVLGHLNFIQEANVYGVSIPGHEGRAGMAAIVLKQDHKLKGTELYNHLVKSLPAYAWPWFLRIQSSLHVTETFKQQKMKLVQEGLNLDLIQDPVYFLDVSQKDYVLLTGAIYQNIATGKINL